MSRCHIVDHLARTLQAPDQCVVYFYFDQNNRIEQNAEFVLRCLLKQLVSQLSGQSDSAPAPLKAAYEKFTFQGCKITPNAEDFANIFIACAKLCDSPVYVLLDAYNEYQENVSNPLSLRLIQLVKSGAVRIYITTRTRQVV